MNAIRQPMACTLVQVYRSIGIRRILRAIVPSCIAGNPGIVWGQREAGGRGSLNTCGTVQCAMQPFAAAMYNKGKGKGGP